MKVYIEKVPKNPLCVEVLITPQAIEDNYLKDELLKSIEKTIGGLIMKHDTDYAELKDYSLKLVKDNERLKAERNHQGFMVKQFQNRLIELMGFDNFLKFEKACFAYMRQQDWYLELKETKCAKHL